MEELQSLMEIRVSQRLHVMQGGAHFLDPRVRTVVDIGGQDSKVIRLNEDGSVKEFCYE